MPSGSEFLWAWEFGDLSSRHLDVGALHRILNLRPWALGFRVWVRHLDVGALHRILPPKLLLLIAVRLPRVLVEAIIEPVRHVRPRLSPRALHKQLRVKDVWVRDLGRWRDSAHEAEDMHVRVHAWVPPCMNEVMMRT